MNSPSLDRVATDVQAELGTIVVVAQACYVAQRLYASSGGRLTHGGSIEALSVLAHEVYGVVTEIGEFGGDGWYGDPHWAVGQAPETFATTVGSELVAEVEKVLAVRRRHKQPVGRRGAR